ncbi:mitochondrial carrier domain-containing protein [Dichotomocladium elegans]|nr:mitochondrial carrier domain-containing protein [Dichotomocladium elegans]
MSDSTSHPPATACAVSGLVAGLAGLATGHPFDAVKVRLQTPAGEYRGFLDCLRVTLRQEKVYGLYKGMASPAAGVAFINAIVFGTYNRILKFQQDNTSLKAIMIAGMGAGVVSSFITCPMELVKVQLQNETVGHTGPIDCLRRIYATGGIRACFTGLVPTAIRELSFGPYFVTYAVTSGFGSILGGGLAGIAAWCSTYPADVIKTRIQAEPNKYKGMIDCFRICYQTEGYRVFFRGLTPTLLRAFPSNAATFFAYTWTMRLLVHDQEKERISVFEEKNVAAI